MHANDVHSRFYVDISNVRIDAHTWPAIIEEMLEEAILRITIPRITNPQDFANRLQMNCRSLVACGNMEILR